ncbi:MAG TPA: methylenetetrahydrofolate reductase [NAD(P)H] [Ferrovibrio sp.]|uniref:methylenetetrahydrofolate reductase [NAD(P)H] n=1 Tax=Ferrovibrio sp. TaxID=1917215 RepID=UPI002ED19E21
MTLIPDSSAYAARRPGPLKISFEFFPPKTAEMEESLWRSVMRLAPLNPRFVSVTYGAGGSTRERTHNTVVRILKETGLKPAAHLTCVGAAKGEVDEVAQHYWDAGIRHIVALRGDPPEGTGKFVAHPDGYANSTELIAGLRKIRDFEISVGCYPEGHPDSTSPRLELEHLKRKVDAGATRCITQYFFDTDVYFRFLDRARSAGITVPIVPGILPVTNFRQVVRFSGSCGASVPAWLADMFDGLDDDPETRRMVAAHVAAEQCRRLLAAGIDEFHFYTLNRADLAYAICHVLGVRPPAIKAGEAAA